MAKIAVIGDVNGKISEVFDKLAKLHTKQNFAFAIVAGNLFADSTLASSEALEDIQELFQGRIEIPLPVYFSLGTRPLPQEVLDKLEKDDGEVCSNLSVLGRKVLIKTAEGIKLVAIGGSHSPSDQVVSGYAASYRDQDVERAADYKSADILVTSEWPTDITTGSAVAYSGPTIPGVQSLGSLCTALKPRYYFSSSLKSFEREPFFHDMPLPRSTTRFISLAPYGNPDKQKWIYAFSLDPTAPPPTDLTSATASPFRPKKRKLSNTEPHPSHFHHDNTYPNHRRRTRPPPPTPQSCYFCLSNATCETHMIGAIGTDVYVATAKGPLSTPATTSLTFPSHLLIIPVSHVPTVTALDADTCVSCPAEMQRYRAALQTMVAAKTTTGEDGRAEYGAVTWEISRAGGVHLHWQFLAVPTALVEDGRVEAGFEVEAENLGYGLFEKGKKGEEAVERGRDYFRVWAWTEAKERMLVLELGEARFDLQFGRRVMAKLLGLEGRVNWRECAQSRVEEEADKKAFEEAFKDFDFAE